MRYVRLLIWNLILSISVMIFVGHLYCRGRWHIYLWDFIGFMGIFWVGWVFTGVLWLALHTFVDDILAEYRLYAMRIRVSKFIDVKSCLQRISQYLCWETRPLSALNKAISVPVQVILLMTGLVVGSMYVYDFLYPISFSRYSDIAMIEALRREVEETFTVTLSDNWLHDLSTIGHDVRYSREKFLDWVDSCNILYKE